MQQQSFAFVTHEADTMEKRQKAPVISMSQQPHEPQQPADVGSLSTSQRHKNSRRDPAVQDSGRQKGPPCGYTRPPMTFPEILTTLETRAALPVGRVKDMKTSLRYLAQALGHASPEECQVGKGGLDPAAWTDALETHFRALEAQGRQVSAATRRNTRNNLRVLFRLAEEHGLLAETLPERLLKKVNRDDFMAELYATAPYQTTYHRQVSPRFGLPQAQWPPDIQAGWRDYQAKCGLRLRPVSLRAHANRLVLYFGYLANVCGRTPTWEDVFDVASVVEFVRWHGARVDQPITTHGQAVVQTIGAIAVVLKHPHAREIADMRNALPTPTPLHTKRNHWVDLATLESVAEACLAEGRRSTPVQSRVRNPGLRRASDFQRGVVLKILVRVPLRSRNVRELRLDRHLCKDHAGQWQLSFRGADLKIGERRGRVNEYNLNLSEYAPAFIPVLEEFLTVHRPRLPGATTSPFLFLTSRGAPYTMRSLAADLLYTVAKHTGQRFYPHLIRTIWATEYLTATQDFTTAATMLGDTVQVVMQTYYDVVNKDQHTKAKAFLSTAFRP